MNKKTLHHRDTETQSTTHNKQQGGLYIHGFTLSDQHVAVNSAWFSLCLRVSVVRDFK